MVHLLGNQQLMPYTLSNSHHHVGSEPRDAPADAPRLCPTMPRGSAEGRGTTQQRISSQTWPLKLAALFTTPSRCHSGPGPMAWKGKDSSVEPYHLYHAELRERSNAGPDCSCDGEATAPVVVVLGHLLRSWRSAPQVLTHLEHSLTTQMQTRTQYPRSTHMELRRLGWHTAIHIQRALGRLLHIPTSCFFLP
jgi:hypothetical protein